MALVGLRLVSVDVVNLWRKRTGSSAARRPLHRPTPRRRREIRPHLSASQPLKWVDSPYKLTMSGAIEAVYIYDEHKYAKGSSTSIPLPN
jgi:hypothetical protein